MKRPYLSQWERQLVYKETFQGVYLAWGIAWLKLGRELMKEIVPIIGRVASHVGMEVKEKYKKHLKIE